MFVLYIVIRCRINPQLAPVAVRRGAARCRCARSCALLRAGIIPLLIFFTMTGLFVMGITSLVESSAVGATAATLAAALSSAG